MKDNKFAIDRFGLHYQTKIYSIKIDLFPLKIREKWRLGVVVFQTYLNVKEIFGQNRRTIIDGGTLSVELTAEHLS